MIGAAAGELLAQLAPSVTTPVVAYTAVLRTEITMIRAIEVGNGTPRIQIHHADDGGAAAVTNRIVDFVMTARQNYIEKCEVGSGIFVKIGGIIYVTTDAADDVVFSIYGHTETLHPADRVRTQ